MFSIIVPNYNGASYLFYFFSNLSKVKNKKLIKRIIIVDNGSSDNSLEILNKTGFKLTVIINEKNLGFAKAVNQGILEAETNYLVIMNNDLRVKKDWFEQIQKVISRWKNKEKIGAYFGKVLDWQGKKIESTGLRFEIKGKASNRGNGELNKKDKYTQEEFVFGAPASIVVYYKPAVLMASLFDEEFFAYEEDVDLALRMQNLGWKTLYVPKAVSYHLGGGTSKKIAYLRQKMDIKNWWFIIIKNYPFKIILKYLPQILLERGKNIFALWQAVPFWKFPFLLIKIYFQIIVKLPKILAKRKPLNIIYQYTQE